MKAYRILGLILCLAIVCAVFTSCAEIGSDNNTVLEAPKLTGNMFEIQNALELSANAEIDLKYPKKGDYLSAFILYDVDDDGDEESIAFYSLGDKSGEIYISLIDNIDGNWTVIGSGSTAAVGVEKVNFADLDGNGTFEIIVGWNVFSTIEKQVAVYTVDNNKLTQRMLESYSEYVICNLMQEGFSQLLTINLDTTEKTSSARLFHLDDTGVVEEGSVDLDGSVSSYMTPVVAKLGSGRPAVYIDALKGVSTMLTEIIYFTPSENTEGTPLVQNEMIYNYVRTSGLISPFHDGTTYENQITARPTAAQIWDVDGDGVPEMPSMTALPGFSAVTNDEKLYYTVWRSYDEKKFNNSLTAIMNYTMGYYIEYPEIWQIDGASAVTVSRTADYSVFVFSAWDSMEQTRGEDLFTIQVFTRENWDNRDLAEYGDYFILRSDKDNIFAARILSHKNSLSLSDTDVKNAFHYIGIE